MSMSAGSGKGAKSDINVTPLVDVCLVLLIIFMVMVPRNVPEISVRVPPESKVPPRKTQNEEPLVIGLSKDGGVLLNRNPIEKGRLGETLAKQLEFREKKVVFVDFDDEANFGTAVDLLDVAKRSGAEVLGIMKDKNRKLSDTLPGRGG